MSSKHHTQGEEAMFTRILKSLTVALALFVLIPAGNAIAMKMNDGSAYLVQSPGPLVSEKLAGLSAEAWRPTKAEYRALMIRSEALNRKYGLGAYQLPAPVVSEKIGGLQLPAQPEESTVVASGGSEFDWGDAGIGAGVILAGILAAMGGAVALRHRYGPLAH
jgi:hypothetical protein